MITELRVMGEQALITGLTACRNKESAGRLVAVFRTWNDMKSKLDY